MYELLHKKKNLEGRYVFAHGHCSNSCRLCFTVRHRNWRRSCNGLVMRFKEIQEGTRCWKGYERKGMKTMFGKRVPNCVKREDVETEAVGSGGGELGSAIGTFAGKAVSYPLMYVELYKREKKETQRKKLLSQRR